MRVRNFTIYKYRIHFVLYMYIIILLYTFFSTFLDTKNIWFDALHKKMNFSIKSCSSKCDQTRSYLWIWSEEILNGRLSFFLQWWIWFSIFSDVLLACACANTISTLCSIYLEFNDLIPSSLITLDLNSDSIVV